MQELLVSQLDRQDRLHPQSNQSSGRVISKEEGTKTARMLAENKASASTTGNNSSSPVVLESDVAKKIVVLRQKQNKATNVKLALRTARQERLPVNELAKEARKVAAIVMRKDVGTADHNKKKRKKKASRKPIK